MRVERSEEESFHRFIMVVNINVVNGMVSIGGSLFAATFWKGNIFTLEGLPTDEPLSLRVEKTDTQIEWKKCNVVSIRLCGGRHAPLNSNSPQSIKLNDTYFTVETDIALKELHLEGDARLLTGDYDVTTDILYADNLETLYSHLHLIYEKTHVIIPKDIDPPPVVHTYSANYNVLSTTGLMAMMLRYRYKNARSCIA